MKGPRAAERLCKGKYAAFVKEIMPNNTFTTLVGVRLAVAIITVTIEVLPS
jgi:hypothetical protein